MGASHPTCQAREAHFNTFDADLKEGEVGLEESDPSTWPDAPPQGVKEEG